MALTDKGLRPRPTEHPVVTVNKYSVYNHRVTVDPHKAMRHNNHNTVNNLRWCKGRCSRVSSAKAWVRAPHWAQAQPAWLLAGSPATRWGAASTETAQLGHQHRSPSPSTSVGMTGWNEGTTLNLAFTGATIVLVIKLAQIIFGHIFYYTTV